MRSTWMNRFFDRLRPSRNGRPSETPRTSGYASFWGHIWGRQPRDLPPFTLTTAQLMLFDPAVRLGLQMRAAPVCSTEIAYREGEQWIPGVRADSEEVGQFVHVQLKRIWSHIDALLTAQTFGWSAGEIVFTLHGGRIEIDELLPVHAHDARALVRGGEVVGTRVLNVKRADEGHVDLYFPKCWFHVFDRQPGQVYGLPALLGAYSPWWDKWMDGGALDVRRLFMHKDAYGGTDMTYPPGTTNIEGRGEIPNRDIAREIAEQLRSGGVTQRPAEYDEQGNELWKLTRATVPSNPEHILKYPRDLDVEIWRGLGIADDVLTSESTGAWAGKRIPMAAFLNGLDIWVTALLRDLTKQILRPLVQMNFGDVQFEVDHKPLAQQGMEQQGETQGQQAGGGQQQPMSTPPPSRMSLDPVEAVGRGVLSAAELVKAARVVLRQRMAWVPYQGDKGGRGWRNTETGEIKYQHDKPSETGQNEPLPGSRRRKKRNATHDTINALVNESIAHPGAASKWIVDLGTIDSRLASMLEDIYGDVAGYVRSLDGSAVVHIMNRHGPENETRPGHIPVTLDDFQAVRDVLDNPDAIYPLMSKQGHPRAAFVKRVNGYYIVIETVRRKTRRLSVQSMRKVTFEPTEKNIRE